MYFPTPYAERKPSPTGLATVLLLHGIVFWALLHMNLISLPAPLAVLTVDLLKPPEPPAPTPPKPRPVAPRPAPLRPPEPVQLAAPAESPAPPTLAVPPAPTFVEPAPPAPPAPAEIIKPRFDADYLLNPKPAYPPLSRRMGEEGRVVLRVHVRADGSASDVQLQATSGSPRLDQAALDTVRRWKFVPARRGDEAVAAWVLVPIVFSLKE